MNAETFNRLHPVGSLVFAYPGARPEDIPSARRLVTRTRTAASVLGGHTDVVWVDGHSSCIALSHVDVVTEADWEAARVAEAAAVAATPDGTQALDDELAVQTLSDAGAMCGVCGDEPGDRNCPDCERVRRGYVAALRTAGWRPMAAPVRAGGRR